MYNTMYNTNNRYLVIVLIVLIPLLVLLVFLKVNLDKFVESSKVKASSVTAAMPAGSHNIGEEITYDIKIGSINLGTSKFTHLNQVTRNGRVLNVMTVNTNMARFRDTELIYSDPNTCLPVRIERDISNWIFKERIVEDYDQERFTVTIEKKKGRRQESMIIKKDSPIHNSILLPQYVRRIPRILKGGIIIANLPNHRFEIEMVSIEEIKTSAGTFKAYHFASKPPQIQIWLSADKNRIPLKIQGTGVIGYTLVMREYSRGGNNQYTDKNGK
ncbi:MAG: DUF3108 domain-containing protein [Candidatus Omnitrophota bacterium]